MRADPASALVLIGGGARAAYQIGFLSELSRQHPDWCPGILCGVSAGALIAGTLAVRGGTIAESLDQQRALWNGLTLDRVCRFRASAVATRSIGWIGRSLRGTSSNGFSGLLDVAPLEALIASGLDADPARSHNRITENLAADVVTALALTASSYTTAQSVTWVETPDARAIRPWESPQRRMEPAKIGVPHIAASVALPLFFPAVQVDGGWYGDGGVRLTAPLSPAVHLGARKILALSTRYRRSPSDVKRPPRAPRLSETAAVLFNALFPDLMDVEAARIRQVNEGVAASADAASRFRHIDVLTLRPSVDLARVADEFENTHGLFWRIAVRRATRRDARASDVVSLLMFHAPYLRRLIDLGEVDARERAAEIAEFFAS